MVDLLVIARDTVDVVEDKGVVRVIVGILLDDGMTVLLEGGVAPLGGSDSKSGG